MSDNLDHDFASAVLLAPDDPELIEAALKNLLPAHPLPFQVTYHCHDVDVPIPLIYRFDTATRLKLPKGELYASLSGEAYDRTFNLQVEVRLPKTEEVFGYQRIPLVDWPEVTGVAGKQLWGVGWPAAKEAGLELPGSHLRIPLIVAMFNEVYAEDIRKILARLEK